VVVANNPEAELIQNSGTELWECEMTITPRRKLGNYKGGKGCRVDQEVLVGGFELPEINVGKRTLESL